MRVSERTSVPSCCRQSLRQMGVPCGFRVYLLGLPPGALQLKLLRGSGTEELNHVTMVSGQAWVHWRCCSSCLPPSNLPEDCINPEFSVLGS